MKLAPSPAVRRGIFTTLILAALIGGAATAGLWWPRLQHWIAATIQHYRVEPAIADDHDHHGGGADEHDDLAAGGHDEHAHAEEHAQHDDHGAAGGMTLELSPQARLNVGLTPEFLRPVELATYQRTIAVPAMVVERPGRTRIEVSTPMSGVVTHVHAVPGEAVPPGTLLFELRITAEEMVESQTALLRTVGDLDVENREIARLQEVTQSGALSQKTLLERQYAKDKLEVLLATQREALRLHGLSEIQIDDITRNRRLLRNLQIYAPQGHTHGVEELRLSGQEVPLSAASFPRIERQVSWQPPGLAPSPEPATSKTPLLLQMVFAHHGETVSAGTTLAELWDLDELYIEGSAFEQDAPLLAECLQHGRRLVARLDTADGQSSLIPDLELVFTANQVDADSRRLRFYVRLPNVMTRRTPSPQGQQFVEWKYRPGQRMQLLLPVEQWEQQIVVPIDAVAEDGIETVVFRQNGLLFDRVPVHLRHRDQTHAVIAWDGTVFPGDVLAHRGAHQLLMALKIQAGQGADPHAGHTH